MKLRDLIVYILLFICLLITLHAVVQMGAVFGANFHVMQAKENYAVTFKSSPVIKEEPYKCVYKKSNGWRSTDSKCSVIHPFLVLPTVEAEGDA